MLLRMLKETFLRRKKRVALASLAVLLGATVTSALLTVYGDITARMSRELRSYGANILVRPRSEALALEIGGVSFTPAGAASLIDEQELPKIKTIFWKSNVTGFVPSLSTVVRVNGQPAVLTGTWFEEEVPIPQLAAVQYASKASTTRETGIFATGVKSVMPWWSVTGSWVKEGDPEGAMVGSALARKLSLSPGDRLAVEREGKSLSLRVDGIVSTGGAEEQQIFVNLPVAQQLMGLKHGVDRVLVSALVTPNDRISEKIKGKDPKAMTPEEYELWYCTPLVESIAFQVEEVISGSKAVPIRQVSEAESNFMARTQLLVLLVTTVALLASVLGVMSAMTAMVMERRKEIGLMKAIGAQDSQIAAIFLLEAGIIGAVSGLIGYVFGLGLAQYIGRQVFGLAFSFSSVAFPLTLALSIAVALLGSFVPVRQGTRAEPVELLRKL